MEGPLDAARHHAAVDGEVGPVQVVVGLVHVAGRSAPLGLVRKQGGVAIDFKRDAFRFKTDALNV